MCDLVEETAAGVKTPHDKLVEFFIEYFVPLLVFNIFLSIAFIITCAVVCSRKCNARRLRSYAQVQRCVAM
jgi:hypothetical protein